MLEEAQPAAFAHDGVLHAFLVRPLPAGACDLTTPYGYGGPRGPARAGGRRFARPAPSAAW